MGVSRDLSVVLSGVALQNPVIPASGCFGFGQEFRQFYDIDMLGSFSFKGTTLHPRFGNQQPRVAECEAGMLNSVGLQNPGIDKVISEELPRLRQCFRQPLIANISGFSVDEYVACCAKISECDQVGLIELNISCPNVHGGGMAFGANAACAARVTEACKRASAKPLYVKLSPNVADITEIARACEAAGADGLSLINTLLGMRIDLGTRRPVLGNQMGGFSGPAVFPVALRMVWQVYEAVTIPIIGMGGIATARDVIEMMMAGASAIEVGAANLVNPCVCKEIIEDLPRVMDELSIVNIREIVGAAHG
ncbi:MAG: dihydroorotate dehydrogenase [Oscillospiraceae bacterium]|jgi:dihydroorotate dehydrogenase (NAD+) catalytic subunit|nr:dihydroorotate dehydrogenase [Oscillospiraceae bacterium]